MRREFALGHLIACGLALCIPSLCAAQESVAGFYKGKTITIMVGFGPGGSTALTAAALASHMGRYLPGNPSFIVQYVPGGAGVVVANDIYNLVPRDGTVFAITKSTAIVAPLLSNKNAQFDGRKFTWIGSANVERTVCLSWYTAPVKTLKDAMTKEFIVGGTTSDAADTVFPKAANKLIGTKIRVVGGYQSSAELNLAMERGELEGNCGLAWPIVKLREPKWLTEKKINILFQMGLEKHPDLPDVPLISDYAKTPEDRQVFEFLFTPQEMGNPFLAPPGIPAERAKALREAFERTVKDPQFLADAGKVGLEVEYGSGEKMEGLLGRVYSAPPEVIARVNAVAE